MANDIGMIDSAAGKDLGTTGTIVDFFYGAEDGSNLKFEISVLEGGKCAVFHNKPFKKDLSWLEFDLDSSRLDFVLDGGESRNFGVPVKQELTKHMHNTHQVLMILMDDEMGDPKEGNYVPLILHKK